MRRRIVATIVGAIAIVAGATAHAQQQTLEEKAQLCAACHGVDGKPIDPNYPIIWGQHQGYLYLQLRDFKLGARKNDLMTPVAQMLERDDMMALAEYFSKKPWPDLRQKHASDADTAAAVRANASIGCTGCHLGEYQGASTVPRLAGQGRDYLLLSMKGFRSGLRANNPGMSDLMRATAESDLAAMANYLAGR